MNQIHRLFLSGSEAKCDNSDGIVVKRIPSAPRELSIVTSGKMDETRKKPMSLKEFRFGNGVYMYFQPCYYDLSKNDEYESNASFYGIEDDHLNTSGTIEKCSDEMMSMLKSKLDEIRSIEKNLTDAIDLLAQTMLGNEEVLYEKQDD